MFPRKTDLSWQITKWIVGPAGLGGWACPLCCLVLVGGRGEVTVTVNELSMDRRRAIVTFLFALGLTNYQLEFERKLICVS